MHKLLILLGLLAAGAAAQAHDTWFEPLPDGRLALGTGNRYPVQETAVGREYLERQGCRVAAGPERTMQPLQHTEHALLLQPAPGASSCWAQLVPLEIELTPPLVALYLREIQAPRWVHEAWTAQQAAGRPWRERYVKHARIELAADAAPVPMAMDLVRSSAPGGGQRFQLLREGRPVPGQALELIAENAQAGIWRRTDAEGSIHLPALPPGRWVLRGTQLVQGEDGVWHSAFVTLAFRSGGGPGPFSVARR